MSGPVFERKRVMDFEIADGRFQFRGHGLRCPENQLVRTFYLRRAVEKIPIITDAIRKLQQESTAIRMETRQIDRDIPRIKEMIARMQCMGAVTGLLQVTGVPETVLAWLTKRDLKVLEALRQVLKQRCALWRLRFRMGPGAPARQSR